MLDSEGEVNPTEEQAAILEELGFSEAQAHHLALAAESGLIHGFSQFGLTPAQVKALVSDYTQVQGDTLIGAVSDLQWLSQLAGSFGIGGDEYIEFLAAADVEDHSYFAPIQGAIQTYEHLLPDDYEQFREKVLQELRNSSVPDALIDALEEALEEGNDPIPGYER